MRHSTLNAETRYPRPPLRLSALTVAWQTTSHMTVTDEVTSSNDVLKSQGHRILKHRLATQLSGIIRYHDMAQDHGPSSPSSTETGAQRAEAATANLLTTYFRYVRGT